MRQYNIFDGDSDYAGFAKAAYKILMSRRWITYTDVMIEANYGKKLDCSISCCKGYGELKKAFPAVCRAINQKAGCDCIETEGSNRNRRFRYIGMEDNPLSDMLNVKIIRDIEKYWNFCQESAGFFPTSWLEYFFRDTKDLLAIKQNKQKGHQILSSSIDRILTNIDLLPSLYMAIINKTALSIEYRPYEEDIQSFTFHPHCLKEYNGRWHLFGHAEGRVPEFGYNLALDRIVSKPRELYNVKYIPSPPNFYNDFFKDIIGVSHYSQEVVQEIHIRAHSKSIFMLMATKKLHHSQETIIPFGEYKDGRYGDFSIQVEVNNEFIGRILQMGEGLEIISPPNVRERLRETVLKMNNLYK